MAGTPKRLFGPQAMAGVPTYTTNIYQGGGGSALIFDVVTHLHITNTTNAAKTFRIFLDATGGNTAGKELFKDVSVPANSSMDYYCRLKMTSADFLVGDGSAAGLSIYGEGEQYVV